MNLSNLNLRLKHKQVFTNTELNIFNKCLRKLKKQWLLAPIFQQLLKSLQRKKLNQKVIATSEYFVDYYDSF